MLWNMAILACSSALATASFWASRSCLTACCLLLQSSFLDSLHHHAMQRCTNLPCNIALIFHVIPRSVALIFHVTDSLECLLTFQHLVKAHLTVLVCLPILSCQCDYRRKNWQLDKEARARDHMLQRTQCSVQKIQTSMAAVVPVSYCCATPAC